MCRVGGLEGWGGVLCHTITLQVLRVSSFVHAPPAPPGFKTPLSITFISRNFLDGIQRAIRLKKIALFHVCFPFFFTPVPAFSPRAFELYFFDQKTPAPTPTGPARDFLSSSSSVGVAFISDAFCRGFCGILSEIPSVIRFVIDVPQWEPSEQLSMR